MMMILYYRFLSVDVHIETNKQNIATIKYSKSKCDLNICYKKHNVCVIETRKKNVVPRWVISISQTFTKHVDHGHGTQTCIEKIPLIRKKLHVSSFVYRIIPAINNNNQKQHKLWNVKLANGFFSMVHHHHLFFCFAILFLSIHV